jgi:hypothetical protein
MSNKIYTQLNKVMKDIGAIPKTRNNTQGSGYKFRGIDDIMEAAQPLFVQHGIVAVPKVTHQTREERATKAGGSINYTILTVDYTFYADDGSAIVATTVGEAMDTSDKSSNKAMSAAYKYALIQVLCIPTEGDNDTENQTLEGSSKPKEGADRPPAMATEYPFENDHFPTDAAPPTNDIAEYEIKVGKKWLGVKFKEMSHHEIEGYMNYFLNDSKKTGTPITGPALEFVNMARKYLGN